MIGLSYIWLWMSRSAAFFALGLIQECGESVAITCSSGTACMNYGSAIVEAFYQRLPLLVLSSDRVPELLNQCEDQMYDQVSTFVSCTKYHCQLPEIDTPKDEWYCNRLINEALIELYPIMDEDLFILISHLLHITKLNMMLKYFQILARSRCINYQ